MKHANDESFAWFHASRFMLGFPAENLCAKLVPDYYSPMMVISRRVISLGIPIHNSVAPVPAPPTPYATAAQIALVHWSIGPPRQGRVGVGSNKIDMRWLLPAATLRTPNYRRLPPPPERDRPPFLLLLRRNDIVVVVSGWGGEWKISSTLVRLEFYFRFSIGLRHRWPIVASSPCCYAAALSLFRPFSQPRARCRRYNRRLGSYCGERGGGARTAVGASGVVRTALAEMKKWRRQEDESHPVGHCRDCGAWIFITKQARSKAKSPHHHHLNHLHNPQYGAAPCHVVAGRARRRGRPRDAPGPRIG